MPNNDPGIEKPAAKPASRKGIGGTYSHSPNCKCKPCGARHRKEEALTLAAGAGGIALAPELLKPEPKVASRHLRERVAQYITYKTAYPDDTQEQLAGRMGIHRNSLRKILLQAKEANLMSFIDPLERVEFELIPKVIDNLSHFLDARDKTITIETAKGTIFKQFQESKGISEGQQTVLAIKIEQPDGQAVKLVTGHIVGRPKELADHSAALSLDFEQENEPQS